MASIFSEQHNLRMETLQGKGRRRRGEGLHSQLRPSPNPSGAATQAKKTQHLATSEFKIQLLFLFLK